MSKKTHWFHHWFNEDYLNLYAYRDEGEAKKHIDFLVKHLPIDGSERVLDLGCGSGRHAHILGNLGIKCVGIDTSETLINEAQKNVDESSNVEFICRDMRHIEDLGKFDIILSMFTSFGYFDSDDENQDVLHIISKALNSKGLFFLDYLNPEHVRKNLVPQEQTNVNGEIVIVKRAIVDDKVAKSIEFPGRSYCESVKLYDYSTIEEMLKASGLKAVNYWGDYSGSKLTADSERMLILCTK